MKTLDWNQIQGIPWKLSLGNRQKAFWYSNLQTNLKKHINQLIASAPVLLGFLSFNNLEINDFYYPSKQVALREF